MYYENTMISVVFLKNLYYSPFLLPKTILIFGLFRIFVYGYKSLTNNGKKKKSLIEKSTFKLRRRKLADGRLSLFS